MSVVIVSHSPKVAEGAADMVRQMVGDEVACAWTGGNPAGGLGTDAEAIREAIERAWREAGVAVLVDLGGAEMNSEMAIEMLAEERRGRSHLQRADRRGCGHRRDRGLGRRHARAGLRGGRGACAAHGDGGPRARRGADHAPERPACPPGGQAHQAREDLPGRDPAPRRARRRLGRREEHRQGDGAQVPHGHHLELEAEGEDAGLRSPSSRPGRARLRRGPWLRLSDRQWRLAWPRRSGRWSGSPCGGAWTLPRRPSGRGEPRLLRCRAGEGRAAAADERGAEDESAILDFQLEAARRPVARRPAVASIGRHARGTAVAGGPRRPDRRLRGGRGRVFPGPCRRFARPEGAGPRAGRRRGDGRSCRAAPSSSAATGRPRGPGARLGAGSAAPRSRPAAPRRHVAMLARARGVPWSPAWARAMPMRRRRCWTPSGPARRPSPGRHPRPLSRAAAPRAPRRPSHRPARTRRRDPVTASGRGHAQRRSPGRGHDELLGRPTASGCCAPSSCSIGRDRLPDEDEQLRAYCAARCGAAASPYRSGRSMSAPTSRSPASACRARQPVPRLARPPPLPRRARDVPPRRSGPCCGPPLGRPPQGDAADGDRRRRRSRRRGPFSRACLGRARGRGRARRHAAARCHGRDAGGGADPRPARAPTSCRSAATTSPSTSWPPPETRAAGWGRSTTRGPPPSSA